MDPPYKTKAQFSGARHPSLLPSAAQQLHQRYNMKSKQHQAPLLPSSAHPSYGTSSDKDDYSTTTSNSTLHPPNNVKQFSRGIFQVAYSPSGSFFSISETLKTLSELQRLAPFAGRLLAEIYTSARAPFMLHLMAGTIQVASPALSMLFSASILCLVEKIVMAPDTVDLHIAALQVLVFKWLFVAILQSLASRAKDDATFIMSGHLRACFLPRLAEASLRLDPTALKSKQAANSLPWEDSFTMEVPGNAFFDEIDRRVRNALTVLAEIGVLLLVILRRGLYDSEARVALFFAVVLPAAILFRPTTGVGGAGYVFWTANEDYHYLAALHKLAFSSSFAGCSQFRRTLARDGLCGYIAGEYRRVCKSLGSANIPAMAIAWGMPVQWSWHVVQGVVVDYPLPICALLLPWRNNPVSSLVTIVFVQHAASLLKESVYKLKLQSTKSLVEVFEMAEDLYAGIEMESTINTGTDVYAYETEKQGMKISFRNVSCSWGTHWWEDTTDALSDVSFEIPAGGFVLVVGKDHAGKTRICELIQRLQEPSAGEILIDDKPIAEFDVDSLRGAMACIAQNEGMYPLPLWRNMSINGRVDCDEAAEMGCAKGLVDGFSNGWETVLEPASVLSQSLAGCEHGIPSHEAAEEMEAHWPTVKPTHLNPGETQKLAATRMFSRLLQLKDKAKLIVCDEATGAMEPCAERRILERLREQKQGKTVIFVAQRFAELAEMADVILVMDAGRLVQHGTHEELVDVQDGVYAKMYNAQTGS
ncbi:P-loop containing nucleoside triphosphate hydrolase protein [Roridomyces roridus]|uniref:P-loop containing nucleoside triphosphate hydrolase protein n=1 Tax=Roridomyces roridus TaxID=1738132 RepID=A0AAD7CL95_9AGAR|nr:P-loop containing nucleoside triphosphate hydrolase protein [Roridomyces roridus]